MDQRPDDFQPLRLNAAMASQRLLVLDFVRLYIERWGEAPSHGEISAGLHIHRDRVRRAIRSLVDDGLLRRMAGPRGLVLPTAEADAIRQLRALGWTVDGDIGLAAKAPLPTVAALDYTGPATEGGTYGETAGARADRPRKRGR